MDRRHFIKNTSATVLGAMTGMASSHAATSPVTMKYRRLGRTGMKISEISLGGSPVPHEGIFKRAIEMGLNYVDTSSSYMNGNSERTIGKILKEHPGKLFVATKIHAGRRGYASIKTLEEEFAGSLKRLGLECVDILMVHGARSAEILASQDIINLFSKYKKEGKIRFSGVSCHYNPVEVLTPAIKSGNWDMITVGYNAFSGSGVSRDGVYKDYLKRSGIEPVIELAKKHDVGVIAMKTMAGGDRQDLSTFRARGVSLPQAKLKWVLENPHVAGVISEMLSFEILEENIAVSGVPMTALERSALNDHIVSCASRVCRMCGACSKQCPQGIAATDIFRYKMYYSGHGKTSKAKQYYRSLPQSRRTGSCSQCRRCETACPHKLPVRKMLGSAHRLLS